MEKAQQWVRDLPEQFTDERVAEVAGTLVSGVASVAIVVVVAIAVLIDGESLLSPDAPAADARRGEHRPTTSAG